jgi:glyoxalase family protein
LENKVLGLHHVTAISSDPQRTIDFYTQILGLRLVKLTVNFDDPSTYHLYFGDEQGSPGTILTFFAWPGQSAGRKGTGQLTSTSFSIPENSLEYWKQRLTSNGITSRESERHFGDSVLTFQDNDGQGLELVESVDDFRPGWKSGPVPEEHAVKGFHGVTLTEENLEPTESILVDTLGFRLKKREDDRFRYEAGNGIGATIVDLLSRPASQRGFVSVGTVHHVAFRATNDDHQKQLRKRILETSMHVTSVIDRLYFHSIYFREPGGVLLEVATDPPGFSIDEEADQLGTRLKLPPWLEASRKDIERDLPPIRQLKTFAA